MKTIFKDGEHLDKQRKEERMFQLWESHVQRPQGEMGRCLKERGLVQQLWQCIWVELKPELSLDELSTGGKETIKQLKSPEWY